MNVPGNLRRQLLLLGVLAGFVLANVVQFPQLEAETSPHWRALYRYASGDLTEIALELDSAGNVPAYYGASLSMGRVAPGAELVVAEDQILSRTIGQRELYGLARISAVERRDYDREDPPEVVGVVAAEGPGGSSGEPYRIVVQDEDVVQIALFLDDDDEFLFIDTRLLDASHPAAS